MYYVFIILIFSFFLPPSVLSDQLSPSCVKLDPCMWNSKGVHLSLWSLDCVSVCECVLVGVGQFVSQRNTERERERHTNIGILWKVSDANLHDTFTPQGRRCGECDEMHCRVYLDWLGPELLQRNRCVWVNDISLEFSDSCTRGNGWFLSYRTVWFTTGAVHDNISCTSEKDYLGKTLKLTCVRLMPPAF